MSLETKEVEEPELSLAAGACGSVKGLWLALATQIEELLGTFDTVASSQ
jgi:hypothetical protein